MVGDAPGRGLFFFKGKEDTASVAPPWQTQRVCLPTRQQSGDHTRRGGSRAGGQLPGDLGIEVLEIDDDGVVGRLVCDRRHLHPGGYVHGGVWVAFADTVAAWGTMRHLAPEQSFTTIELKTNVFASGVVGDELLATGEPLHRGSRTQVWEVRVPKGRSPGGQLRLHPDGAQRRVAGGELRARRRRRRAGRSPGAGRAGARRLAARSGRSARWPRRSGGPRGELAELGVGRGDVVMTLIGNRAGVGLGDGGVLSASARSCCPAPSSCGRRTCGCASTWRAPR